MLFATREELNRLVPAECVSYLDSAHERGVNPMKDDLIRMINERCIYDTQFFAQTYMAESFEDPMTYQNKEVWALLDDESQPKTAVCAWRGFGKTTMYVAKRVKSICFRHRQFMMLVGSSHDYAAQITESIKSEILANHRIRFVFGNMKARSYEDVDLAFSKKSWFACDPQTGEHVVRTESEEVSQW